ncbi:hypothetical protein GN155_008860 [Alcanivorax sp. ZXX171]|nr:hypothetical protein [Alcanivorax sp. ZXX171]
MPDLSETPEANLDPRIVRHLQPGEKVMWQGAPRPGTFLSPIALALCVFFIVYGLLALFGLADRYVIVPGDPFTLQRIGPALLLVAGPGWLLHWMWTERGANWAYAITDRRLLSVRGNTLVRSVEPKEIRSFEYRQDVAYWRYLNPRVRNRTIGREREKRYPGFHGLEDSEDMVDTLNAWAEDFTARAGEDAAAFVERTRSVAEYDDPPEGVQRIRHEDTGLTIDVPDGWSTTVSLDRIGPLRIFGITLLERFIQSGKERAYANGIRWNSLTVRGAPDAGLNLTVLDEPLQKTLEQVRDDPWAERFDLKLMQSTPGLEIGGLRGFSLVRRMPAGANLANFGKVAAPVATRHAWLGRGGMHVEIIGMARLDQPDVQDAIDAMIDSIRGLGDDAAGR